MMMNFKYLSFLVLFLFVLPIYADALKNNSEKDAKVIVDKLSSRMTSPLQSKSISLSYKKTVEHWALYAEQWEFVRNGESILSLPVLNKLMNVWLKDKSKVIEIHYPGGEEGEFWVQELMDWLVSLGLPSSQMLAIPGSGADDVIKFFLVK